MVRELTHGSLIVIAWLCWLCKPADPHFPQGIDLVNSFSFVEMLLAVWVGWIFQFDIGFDIQNSGCSIVFKIGMNKCFFLFYLLLWYHKKINYFSMIETLIIKGKPQSVGGMFSQFGKLDFFFLPMLKLGWICCLILL